MQEMFKEQATQLEELKIRVQQQESVINSMQRNKSIEMDYKSAGIINATLRQGT